MRKNLLECSSQSEIVLTSDELSKSFFVDRVIGTGASCIVYEAHSYDLYGNRHNYRLKECYPYQARIVRRGLRLDWNNESEKERYLRQFQEAYQRLAQIQMEQSLGNNSVHTVELFQQNETMYSVVDVDFGHSYADDTDTSITKAVQVSLVLAKIIDRLHKKGFLHLDIKPSNFLVEYEPSLMLRLFDVDSLVSMDQLHNNEESVLSFSQEWAAPEQKQGDFQKICPATDVYAIGAILFTKVMKRPVSHRDNSIFSDWNFDEEWFDGINPKVCRLLRKVFKKTLTVSPKRRYQDAYSLAEDLMDIECLLASGEPYLLSDCPQSNVHFIGRQNELKEIQNAFSSGKRAVFLHGIGGIGKSEIAKKYAEIHKHEYDAILFWRYDDSLKELFDEVEIQNFSGDERDHKRALKKLLNEHILIIVDNFDVSVGEDDFLEQLLRYKSRMIFTSRTDFSSYGGSIQHIEVSNLEEQYLITLFNHECGNRIETTRELLVLKKLIRLINSYTLLIPIMAKQLVNTGMRIEELYLKYKEGFSDSEESIRILVSKDECVYRKTPIEIMRVVFRMSELTEIQKQVLRNVYILRFLKINREQYLELTCPIDESFDDHLNAINELIELGWIQNCKDGTDCFEIHAVILQMIKLELQPYACNASSIFILLHWRGFWYGKYCASDEEYNELTPDDDYALSAEMQKRCEYFFLLIKHLDLGFSDYHSLCNLVYIDYILQDRIEDMIEGGLIITQELLEYLESLFKKEIDKICENTRLQLLDMIQELLETELSKISNGADNAEATLQIQKLREKHRLLEKKNSLDIETVMSVRESHGILFRMYYTICSGLLLVWLNNYLCIYSSKEQIEHRKEMAAYYFEQSQTYLKAFSEEDQLKKTKELSKACLKNFNCVKKEDIDIRIVDYIHQHQKDKVGLKFFEEFGYPLSKKWQIYKEAQQQRDLEHKREFAEYLNREEEYTKINHVYSDRFFDAYWSKEYMREADIILQDLRSDDRIPWAVKYGHLGNIACKLFWWTVYMGANPEATKSIKWDFIDKLFHEKEMIEQQYKPNMDDLSEDIDEIEEDYWFSPGEKRFSQWYMIAVAAAHHRKDELLNLLKEYFHVEQRLEKGEFPTFDHTIQTAMINLETCHLIVDFLIQYFVPKDIDPQREREFAEELHRISDFAELAAAEIGEDHPDYARFLQIHREYAERHDKALDFQISLKSEDPEAWN